MRFRLGHFNLSSTENYIKHRLKVAGATRMLFTSEALESIQMYSTGIPRLINNICDNALLEGMLSKSDLIGRAIIEKVADELGLARASKDLLQEIESQRSSQDAAASGASISVQPGTAQRGASPGTPVEGRSSSGKTIVSGEEKIEIDEILDSLDIE
jgi:hypothetical protein